MKSNFRKTRCGMQGSSITVDNNKNCENCSFCHRNCPAAIKNFKAQSQCITCCANKSKISDTLSLKSKDIKNNVIYTVVAVGIYLIFRHKADVIRIFG